MWPLKIFCCLIVLPSIIHGNNIKYHLDNMANKAETMNNMIEMVPDGFLGDGYFAHVYKGIRISDRRPLALKFAPLIEEKSMELEYNIYTYLKAINVTEVEQFGIPAIYYYGNCLYDSIIIIAVTSLERDLWTIANDGHFVEYPINSLILLKQFIVTTKYMHSRGVRHDDIKPENIMFRRDRSFLIDFNLSCKIEEMGRGGTIEYYSRKAHKSEKRTPMCDWESFLYVLCEINRVMLKFLPHMGFDTSERLIAMDSAGKMKFEINDTISAIKLAITDVHLRPVFLAFAEHVLLSNNKFPDYDRMYQMVDEAIESMFKKFPKYTKFYTWLKPTEIMEAKLDLANHPVPDVENALIKPPHLIDFNTYRYPEPNRDKFGGFGYMSTITSKFSLLVKSALS